MNSKTMTSSRTIQWLLIFCLCLSLVLSFSSRKLGDDNFNYAIEELNDFDNSIFLNNITIHNPTASQSPRFTANRTMSMLTHLFNDNWNNAALFLIRFNYVLYAILFFVLIIRFFPQFQLLTVTIISVVFLSGYLINLGSFGFNGAEDVFLGTGMVFAMLAIAVILPTRCCECHKIAKEHWDITWIFLSIAALMHIHEGIWAASIVGLIWIADCIVDKRIQWKKIRCLPIYIASLIIVIFPALKGAGTVDSKLFSQIYVFLRTPHHLQVSSWGIITISVYFVLIMCAWGYLKYATRSEKRDLLRYSLLIAWVAILVITQYIFYELIPSSTIITMYISKCYKYVTWLAVLIYLTVGIERFEAGKYFQGMCLLGIVIMPHSYGRSVLALAELVLFILFTVLFLIAEKNDIDRAFNKIFKGKYFQVCVCLLLITLFIRLVLNRNITQLITGVPLLILAGFLILSFEVPKKNTRFPKTWICTSVAVITVLCCIFTFVYPKRDVTRKIVGIGIIDGDQFVKNSIDEDVYNLAKKYKSVTNVDAEFLADPDDRNYNGFQLVSQRSSYAIYKNVPSYKVTIPIWYDRIKAARNILASDNLALDVKKFMTTENLSDVLVSGDQAVNLQNSGAFDLLASEGVYSVFRVKK